MRLLPDLATSLARYCIRADSPYDIFHSHMSLLDRYVLKVFLIPLLLCFSGFLAVWLVFDLGDNIGDFMEAGVPLQRVAYFYVTQLPQFVVICLPVGLLLALLYSLSKMSRANEIISMLGAGRSITRIILPLLGVGLIATGVSLTLNYKLAPHAVAIRDDLLEELTSGQRKQKQVRAHLYRNRTDFRTWFIGKFSKPPMTAPSKRIHIIQQDAEGNVLRKYYASKMTFDNARKEWTFSSGKYLDFDKEGNVVNDQGFSEEVIKGWSETPWRIASANLKPEFLSIPELKEYLRYNADFPDAQLAPFRTQLKYLWALPWTCFVVVFIAAPLGIVYSRRGVLAGVASSLFIFFGMVFLTELSLALGKGGRIPPALAAWAPTFFFGFIGMTLLYFRSTNRDLPTIRLRRASSTPARVRAVATTAGCVTIALMPSDWEIKGRAERCAVTGRNFEEGEFYYTLLFREAEGFSRQDICEQAWKESRDKIKPYSFWRAKFELPPPPEEETLKKETAENLLRRYMEEEHAEHANARYILALMLERKRILKQIEAKQTHEGRTLIYEHSKTGEVFVVPEPRLKLDQIESVQSEVAAILK